MGRKGRGGRNGREELHVNVPSFFRCPISLDVMKSPVSLCTGVTYDRSSIQAWLDTGHNTCPATMQVLPTTDFVPNHNVRRLIQLWSAQPHHGQQLQQQQQGQQLEQPNPALAAPASPRILVCGLPSATDPLLHLRKLVEIAEDAAGIRELVENAGCVLPALQGVLVREGLELEAREAAVRILSAVLLARKEGGGEIADEAPDPRILPSLVAVLKLGSLESRISAAWAVEIMAAAGSQPKLHIAEAEGMLAELLRLVADEKGSPPADPRAIEAGLASLVAVSALRRVRPQIVSLGAVPILGRLLAQPSTSAAAAERALKLMEAASTCTEGRAAICGDPGAVAAVVGRMTKVRPQASEHAVAVLWSVCCLFRDQRAQESAAAGGGLAKVLLLMQSNCSPAARQMAGDLLKILGANSKSGPPSYESKTTHIMPF